MNPFFLVHQGFGLAHVITVLLPEIYFSFAAMRKLFYSKRNTILFHLLFWAGLYLIWILVFQRRAFVFTRTMTVEFCYLIFIAAIYYFNQFYNIPRFLYKKKYFMFYLLLVAAVVAGALLRVPLAMYLNEQVFIPGKPQPGLPELFLNSLLNIFIWVICLVAGKLIFDRIRFQQYVDKMEKERSKTELDFLQAQFNPHFLFNSINSIYGHIDKKNNTARNMLLTFSNMLRYQLYECNTEQINIDKEIGYIKNYVALQQIRKEEDLIVQLKIDENVRGFNIAPLLFIGFIENAFKYVGHIDDEEERVEIAMKRNEDQLLFRVYNTKEPRPRDTVLHKGIGIANAKRRLELLYPGKYLLDINNNEQFYEVNLIVTLT